MRRPTASEVLAAHGRTVPDVIAPGLRVLFCGINPGLYSASVGHHFARPGNRFWPVLHASGFTPRLFSPEEDRRLPAFGLGITNIVERATAGANELSTEELREGIRRLEAKLRRFRPAVLAVLGIGAFRAAFGRRDAMPGAQPERIGETSLWLLPNPSGLNAHYRPPELAALFRELRESALGPE